MVSNHEYIRLCSAYSPGGGGSIATNKVSASADFACGLLYTQTFFLQTVHVIERSGTVQYNALPPADGIKLPTLDCRLEGRESPGSTSGSDIITLSVGQSINATALRYREANAGVLRMCGDRSLPVWPQHRRSSRTRPHRSGAGLKV